MTKSTYPWDTPGLPARDRRCPWHSGLCAYRSDDPARCPLCHATTASGRCTCVPGDGTLGPLLLDAALRAGATLTAKELAARHNLTSLAAARIRGRAQTITRHTEDGAA